MSESSTVTLVGRFQDDITPGLERQKNTLIEVERAIKSAQSSADAWTSGIKSQAQALNDADNALRNNLTTMQAQLSILKDPAYAQQITQSKALRAEIDELTKAKRVENDVDGISVRQRRELIVMGHELMMGRTKNLMGSAMVLEEGEGGAAGALKAAVALMGGPYVVAAGLAAVATTGVAVALWKASEAEAEMVHKTNLLGQTLGVSGEAIRGFQYMAVGTSVTTEEMGRVFGIFEKNLGKNSEKFRELGITARDPLEAFEQLMDKAKGMGDAVQRAAFLNETLGRGWEKITPVILQGGEAAKDAMEKMKISPDVLASLEKANSAQIEIDKSWMSISLHAGEAFAGIRAGFKDLEADGAKLAENHGIMAALGALTFRGRALANAERAKNPTEGLGPAAAPIMSEEQLTALKEADKQLKKGSLEAAIQGVKDEWKARIDLFKAGTPEYLKEVSAEAQAEGEVRKAWAKKGGHKAKDESVYGTTHADADFEKATGISYGAYSMAHPGGTEADGPGRGASVTKGMAAEDEKKAKAEATEQKKWIKEATDAQANSAKITMNWDKAIADARRKEHEEHVKEITKEADLIQGFAAQELATTLHGKMTAKQLETDFTNILIQQFAERATKWIEGEALKLIFSEGATTTATATSVAAASVAGAAWSAPSMMASIGTFGGATAAGEASWFQAMAAGEAFGLAAHAKGGTQFGGNAWRHESGPEMAHAIVPTQIYQASHTHSSTSTTNAPITINIHGGDQATILRTIRNATTNGGGTSH